MGKKYPVHAVRDAIRERHNVLTRAATFAFCRAFYDIYGREAVVDDVVANGDVEQLMERAESYLESW